VAFNQRTTKSWLVTEVLHNALTSLLLTP